MGMTMYVGVSGKTFKAMVMAPNRTIGLTAPLTILSNTGISILWLCPLKRVPMSGVSLS